MSFTASFAWPCVLSDRPPVLWWLSHVEGRDAVTCCGWDPARILPLPHLCSGLLYRILPLPHLCSALRYRTLPLPLLYSALLSRTLGKGGKNKVVYALLSQPHKHLRHGKQRCTTQGSNQRLVGPLNLPRIRCQTSGAKHPVSNTL